MRQFRVLEIPAILFIFFVVANRSFAIEDISFDDETSYLFRGLGSSGGNWPGFTDGATYSDMYWVISLFISDPVNIYFVGKAMSSVLLVFGTWIAARLLVNRYLAWALTAAVAVTPVVFVWPGVAGPATGLMLVGLALSLRYRCLGSMALTTSLYWVAAGSRPEFAWVAFILSIVTLTVTLKILFTAATPIFFKVRNTVIGLSGAVFTPVTLIMVHGSPFASNGRDWLAFAQHYSLRHFMTGENPWLQADAIVQRSFPTATGVTQAMAENSFAFSSHMFANMLYAPRGFVSNLVGEQESIFSSGLVSLLVFVALIISTGLVFAVNRSYSIEWLKKNLSKTQIIKRYWFFLVFFLSFTALLLPVVIVYPRLHYLVFPVPVFVIGLGIFIDRCNQRIRINNPLFAILMILFLAWTIQTSLLTVNRLSQPPTMAASATEMFKQGKEWRMLGVEWGFEVYVPGLEKIDPELPATQESITAYLERLKINAVLITAGLKSSNFAKIIGFENFIEEPGKFGFQPIVNGSPIFTRT